jgi:EAL domain-containing protein (putative c-di-GMP-specific phosphodiesterase class I)
MRCSVARRARPRNVKSGPPSGGIPWGAGETKDGSRSGVDDYGTGYSSLQYLRRFPVDWLKIAKPFVDGVDGSDAQARLARAIVDLAHSLGIEVIAEGIESRHQADVLNQLGCLAGQGFHYSPPLPADEVTAHLAAVGAAR